MKIWIVQTGEPLHIDDQRLRPMRAINLSRKLAREGNEVLVISSDFDHYSKLHRNRANVEIHVEKGLSLFLISSPGYSKHISIRRFWDHIILGLNLQKNLSKLPRPDVIFIGYPPIETAWVVARWARKTSIPYAIDVKDAWPELFIEVAPKFFKFPLRILMEPLFRMSTYVMHNSSLIFATTEPFLEWSLRKSKRERNSIDSMAPLTSQEFEISLEETNNSARFWDDLGVDDSTIKRIYFVGSITTSYDFTPLTELARNSNIQVIIAGLGPLRKNLLELSHTIENLIVPGWINQSQQEVLAKRSLFSVVPLVNRFDFDMSVTNKTIDSLRLGKPVLTSNFGLFESFIGPHGLGYFYKSQNLKYIIESAVLHPEIHEEFSKRCRQLYDSKFEFHKVYDEIMNRVKSISTS